MLRLVLCRRRLAGLEGVLRVTFRETVGGRLCSPRGGDRSFVYSYRKLPDLRPAHFFSTSSNPSLPDEDRLVYTGNLTGTVLGVKFFSYSTSMVTLCLLPYILKKPGIGVDSLVLKVTFYGVVGFFTFITPVILHFITKGYVARMYHNSDKDLYTAVTFNVFLGEKRTVFSPADVEVPGLSKMFTTFYVKKKSMLVDPDLFPNPWDYHHLMGYDKPFRFDPKDLNKPPKDQ